MPRTAKKIPGLLSITEAATIAKKSRQTIHMWTRLGHWAADGVLTSQKVNGHVYVSKRDLTAFLRAIGREKR